MVWAAANSLPRELSTLYTLGTTSSSVRSTARLAAALLLIFISHPVSAGFWEDRRLARAKLLTTFENDSNFGKASPAAPRAPRVILVAEGAVENAADARGLSRELASLAAIFKFSLIGVAGESGALDIGRFRRLTPVHRRKILADYFVDVGVLTGAEHGALTVEHPMNVFGLEDPRFLSVGRALRRKVLDQTPEAREALRAFRAALRGVLETEGSSTFRVFLDRRESWRRGRLPLAGYLSALFELVPDMAGSAPPCIAAYRELAHRESVLDPARVARERARLIDLLAPRLDDVALRRLTAEALACRLGERSPRAFHDALLGAAATAGVAPPAGSALRSYVDVLGEIEGLFPGDIAEGLRSWEAAAARRLAVTGVQRALWELWQDADAFQMLFESPPTDQVRQALAARAHRLTQTRAFWRDTFEHSVVQAPPVSPSDVAGPFLDRLETEGSRRSALFENLLARLPRAGPICVVVPAHWIGPLEEALAARGIEHTAVQPRPAGGIEKRSVLITLPRCLSGDVCVSHPASPDHAAFLGAWKALSGPAFELTARPAYETLRAE